jgi:hypothetical protein
VAMQKTKNVSADVFVSRANVRDASCFSPPDPDEGHRLIQAFCGIHQPVLREAILALVTELQKQSDQTRWSFRDDAKFST